MVLGQYLVVLVSTWWYWVNNGWYWSVFGGTGSILGGTGQFLVVLGHYWMVLVSTWWYWVIIGWYLGPLGSTMVNLDIWSGLVITKFRSVSGRPDRMGWDGTDVS